MGKETVEAKVIDAEIIDDDKSISEKSVYVQIPHRAAEAIEALADTVATVSGERADEMRKKAADIRSIGKNVETATTAGKQLFSAVKEAAEKVGLQPHFVRRIDRRRR